MSEKVDTCLTSLPTCPFCGWRDMNWWDGGTLQNDDDVEFVTCGSCEKEFLATIHVDVSFTTAKP